MKEYPDFSQFTEYQPTRSISQDTRTESGQVFSSQSTFQAETEILFQRSAREKTVSLADNLRPEIMRDFLEDYYRDVLDNDTVPDSEKLQTIMKSIPRRDIRGTKDANEFRVRKLRKADKEIRRYKSEYGDPAKYFEENPPLVCQFNDEKGNPTFALLRGHHEMRRAGHYRVENVSSQVITAQGLADALNRYEPPKQIGHVAETTVIDFLKNQIKETKESFRTEKSMDAPISSPSYK